MRGFQTKKIIVPLVDVIQIMVAAFPDHVMEGIRKDEYIAMI